MSEGPSGVSFLTPRDIADRLQISLNAVYRMTSANEIPHYKVGRRVRFDPREIADWMSERRVTPGSKEWELPEKRPA